MGLITGVFAGASSSDPMLHDLAAGLKRGGVILSVERSSFDGAERAERIFQSHRGHVVRKHLLSTPTKREERELARNPLPSSSEP